MSNNFAAAQERMLARQATRRAEIESERTAYVAALQHSPLTRLPFPLNQCAEPVSSFWSLLNDSEGTKPAFRVGQVDAELLDEELLVLLKGQIGEGLKYFGAHIQDDWSKEISLALRAILFKLSVWDHDASYGATLQNLRFTDARKNDPSLPRPTRLQKGLYGVITVLGRYGWDKWEEWLVEKDDGYTELSPRIRFLSRLTDRLSTFHSVAAFISFLVFLVNGRYRTLTDRLLRLRLNSPASQIHREVSFEYLNRQLVWHAFTEFLLFILPLVGISRWRRWIGRAWRKTKMALQAEAEENGLVSRSGPLAHLPERTCAICYQDQNPTSTSEAEILGANVGAAGGVIGSATTDVVNPYETAYGCIYCFVCVATKIEAEEGSGWPCLRCGELVYKCKPWSGDVIMKKHTPSKNVNFIEQEKDQVTTREGIHSDLGSSQWTLEGSAGKEG